jgi:hypothetical protein
MLIRILRKSCTGEILSNNDIKKKERGGRQRRAFDTSLMNDRSVG